MGDTITVEYTNFASYRHAILEIQIGNLIIIKGENNKGKSVLLYGLEWLLMNDPAAKTLINNTALAENSKAELRVKISQGDNVIEISRTLDAIKYIINGKTYSKIGKSNIFNVAENVTVPGIIYIKDITTPLLNMHGEDRGFFPLDYNDQGIFTLFEKLLGLINSKKICSIIQKEITENTAMQTVLNDSINKDTLKIDSLSKTFNAINIEKLTDLYNQIEKTSGNIVKLNQLYETLKQLSGIYNITLPSIIECQNMSKLLQEHIALLNNYRGINKLIKQITQVKICETFDTSDIVNTMQIIYNQTCTKNQIIESIKELELAENSLATKLQQLDILKQKVTDMDVCPLCGHAKEER